MADKKVDIKKELHKKLYLHGFDWETDKKVAVDYPIYDNKDGEILGLRVYFSIDRLERTDDDKCAVPLWIFNTEVKAAFIRDEKKGVLKNPKDNYVFCENLSCFYENPETGEREEFEILPEDIKL